MRKLSDWTTSVTRALSDDAVSPQAARIASEVATAMFRIAYADWLEAPEG